MRYSSHKLAPALLLAISLTANLLGTSVAEAQGGFTIEIKKEGNNWTLPQTPAPTTGTGSSCPAGTICGGGSSSFSEGASCVGGNCSGDSSGYSSCSGSACIDQARQKDALYCQSSAMGMGGILPSSSGLANILATNLSQSFNNTISNLMVNTIPNIVNRELTSRLPDLIAGSLRRDLPGRLNNQISYMSGLGMTETEIRSFLPEIILRFIQSITNETISREVPTIIAQGVGEELPPVLVEQINSQVPGIVNAQLGGSIDSLVATTSDELGRLGRVNDNEFADALTEGVIAQTQQSITQSGSVVTLAENIGTILAQQIAPQVISQIINQTGSLFSGPESFRSSVDSTVGGLLGSGYDLSGGISGDFLNPVVAGVTPALSNGVASGIASMQSSIFNVPITGNLITGPITGIGNDAAFGVINNSSLITEGAFSASGFGGIATGAYMGLAGGVIGGVSGGLSGLVAGVPYAGPLLAPMVQQVTEQALGQLLLPLGAGGAGLPVADLGAQTALNQGFQGLGRINSQIQGNTAQSARNAEIQTNLQRSICTKQALTAGSVGRLEDATYKYDPDAYASSLLKLVGLLKGAANYFSQSYDPGTKGDVTSGSGATNRQGEGVVAQLSTNLKRATAEGQKKALSDASADQNPEIKEAATKLAAQKRVSPFASTVDKTECAKLNSKADLNQMSAERYHALSMECSRANNSPRAVAANLDKAMTTAGEEKKFEETVRYVANQGFNETRFCARWTPEPMEAASFADTLTPVSGASGPEYCAEWITLTPGSANKDYYMKLLFAIFDKVIQADEIREDRANDLTSIPENLVKNLNRGIENNSNFNVGSDPCPTTSPCSSTGWNPQQTQPTTLSQSFNSGIDYGLGQAVGNLGQNLGGAADRALTDLIYGGNNNYSSGGSGGLNFNLPAINLPNAKIIEFIPLADPFRLNWKTEGAIICRADNEWVGSDIKAGQSIGESGSILIDRNQITSGANYVLTCVGYDLGTVKRTVTITPQNI